MLKFKTKPIRKNKNTKLLFTRSKEDQEHQELYEQSQKLQIVQSQKTKHEQAFKIIQQQRQLSKIKNNLKQNYREKIDEFNKKLARIPEHFDIPKVGPG